MTDFQSKVHEVADTIGTPEGQEGPIARKIERVTSKLPSDTFLWAAGVSILGSLALHTMGRKEDAIFVGHWAPSFMLLGLYNKLVKVAGSDRYDTAAGQLAR